jgi:phage-related minor tail protein
MADDISIIIGTNAGQVSKEFDNLGLTVLAQVKKLEAMERGYSSLDKAFNAGIIDAQQYSKGIQQLDAAFEQTSSSVIAATNNIKTFTNTQSSAAIAAAKLSDAQRMAGKSTNRFGMYAQQVGYQVGDFFVQVQSGTNALVAFGQQGTQLAGLLPGIYGAILGIGLSVTTAVLQSSGALKGLTFDFKRFGEDALKFLEPIMPALRFLGEAFLVFGGIVVDAMNLVINSVQYMVAAFMAVPSSIQAGVDWIDGQFHRMVLLTENASLKAQASWQGLKDLISGTTTMVSIVDLDANGNSFETTISAVEDLTWKANNLSEQAGILGEKLKETGGFGKSMAESLGEVEKIDLRNLLGYFGQAKGAAESTGEAIKEVEQKVNSLAQSMAQSIGNGFMSMVDGTQSVKDAFRSMARDIIKQLYEVLVVQQLVGSAQNGTGIAGFLGNLFKSANGNVFQGGSPVSAYANGGIVGSPTYFPMSGGKTGLMGEAGPEAIMPLKRGANGKLGVQVDGNSGDNIVVNQTFNFSANGDESVKKIIAQAAPQIAQMTQQKIMDSRRRGGSMKAAFG